MGSRRLTPATHHRRNPSKASYPNKHAAFPEGSGVLFDRDT
jgi:hypothetical protein